VDFVHPTEVYHLDNRFPLSFFYIYGRGDLILSGCGGDEGKDSFTGDIQGDDLHVFQYKFFTNTLTDGQKRQIRKSLVQLLSKHSNTSQWTLLIPKDFTPAELRWFESLRQEYSNLSLDFWGYSKLKNLLVKHYRLFYDYFPIPEHIRIEIDRHVNDLKRDIAFPLFALGTLEDKS